MLKENNLLVQVGERVGYLALVTVTEDPTGRIYDHRENKFIGWVYNLDKFWQCHLGDDWCCLEVRVGSLALRRPRIAALVEIGTKDRIIAR